MRAIRRLLVVVATMTALTILAPAVSAAPGHADRTFHIEKLCNAEGSACTITESNYGPIRVGSTITYVGDSFDALAATVHVKHGSATGACDIASVFDADPSPGVCTFTGGTGRLRKFTATISVDMLAFYADGTSLWSWDGTLDRPGPHH